MRWVSSGGVVGVLAALLGVSSEAAACGGLFCSASAPVNQTAERIIFAQDGDRVHAVIEVQYEGPSERFAWVLPVPSGEVVEVGVSSTQILDALQAASNPQYNLTTTFADCGSRGGNADAGVDFAPGLSDSADEGAIVVASGNVGPYDYVQLSVDDAAANPAREALDWLAENEFDVSNLGEDLIGEYLEGGSDLIAFRLSKGNSSGSIRPVRLSWNADNPVIPIRPTAVAATEDMGILVWVLGEARAVPVNYLSLELNEARINWFNPNANYNDVVIEAADEAGGLGFVTEQSTDTSDFRGALVSEATSSEFEALLASPPTTARATLEQTLTLAQYFDNQTFVTRAYDGVLDVLGDPEVVQLRPGYDAEALFECVGCYFDDPDYDAETDPTSGMDIGVFLDRMERDVFLPLRETVELFESFDKVTRFYTTLSPDEMTMDPVFDFNADLGPVSNVHTATANVRCDGDQVITVESGATVLTDGSSWSGVAADTPYNLRVLQLSTSGKGDVVRDNTKDILDALVAPPPERDANSSYTGCSLTPRGLSQGASTPRSSKAPFGWASLLSLGLIAAWVRRRQLATFPRRRITTFPRQTDTP